MKSKRIFVILSAISILMFAQILPAATLSQKSQIVTPTLAGSWRTTISPIPGDPNQFPAFPGLMTINDEGTLVETDGSQLVPVPAGVLAPNTLYASAGHGVWATLPLQQYQLKFIQIVVDGNNTTLFGTVTLQFTVKITHDGNQFLGKGTFTFADANGNTIFAGAEQINGQRITVE